MYSFCLSFVWLSAVVYTNAAVALYKAQEMPAEFANEEGCYIEHLNKVIPYGDYYPEKSCYKYTCDTDNITQAFSCGVVVVDKRCALVSNEAANYPDCCPTEMCGTIPPEYLTEEENNTKPVLEESSEEGTKSPEESSEEGRTGPPGFESLVERVATEGSVVTVGQVNEILIAEENSNLGGQVV